MKIKDQDEWHKWVSSNKDPYGKCVVRYARRWADLMEEAMIDGTPLGSIAKDTSHEADTDAITSFMYGCAVRVLASVWEHGAELRQWHNADKQPTGGGE